MVMYMRHSCCASVLDSEFKELSKYKGFQTKPVITILEAFINASVIFVQ